MVFVESRIRNKKSDHSIVTRILPTDITVSNTNIMRSRFSNLLTSRKADGRVYIIHNTAAIPSSRPIKDRNSGTNVRLAGTPSH